MFWWFFFLYVQSSYFRDWRRGLGHKAGGEFHILPLAGEMLMRHPVTLCFCAPISQLIMMQIEV